MEFEKWETNKRHVHATSGTFICEAFSPELAAEIVREHNATRRIPTVTMQHLINAGLNGFAFELVSESLAGKKLDKVLEPIRFEFRGVIYTLESATP